MDIALNFRANLTIEYRNIFISIEPSLLLLHWGLYKNIQIEQKAGTILVHIGPFVLGIFWGFRSEEEIEAWRNQFLGREVEYGHLELD